jgi:hypothetical protein
MDWLQVPSRGIDKLKASLRKMDKLQVRSRRMDTMFVFTGRLRMHSLPTRLLFCCVAAVALSTAALAEETEERVLEAGKWYPTLESGINITQSSYSENWAGGDRGAIVWSWILNGTLENQIHEKLNWFNQLKLAFGQTHLQAVETEGDNLGDRSWDKPEKSTDLTDFETIARFTLGGFVDPFVAGRFESQFQDASDGAGRNLTLNPLKFKETAGIAKQFIDEEERSLLSRLGFTFRQNTRKLFEVPAGDSLAKFNDTTQSEMTNDGGIEFVTDYKTKILDDRVSWTSKLGFYQPIFYSGKDELEDQTAGDLAAAGLDPDIADFTTTIDIDWENIFTTQITKLISVNLYTRWVYDKYDNSVMPVLMDDGSLADPGVVRAAVRKAGQFKQTLGIGVTYRFL